MSKKLESVTTVEFLRECFRYEPETGDMYWREDRPVSHFKTLRGYLGWKKVCAGKFAGSKGNIRNTSYYLIKVAGIRSMVHQVIFAIVHGRFANLVDHKDGNGLNNKINNLLESCLVNNPKNQALSKRNTSGLGGVYWCKQTDKWVVKCSISKGESRTNIYLGHHETIFEAACARLSWANSQGYSHRHGR